MLRRLLYGTCSCSIVGGNVPEPPEITRLREALRPEKDFRGVSAPHRKHMAELAVLQILDSIARGLLPLGAWENYWISAALICLRWSAYGAAYVSTVTALDLPATRSPLEYPTWATSPRTLVQLRAELDAMVGRPVLEP